MRKGARTHARVRAERLILSLLNIGKTLSLF